MIILLRSMYTELNQACGQYAAAWRAGNTWAKLLGMWYGRAGQHPSIC